MAKRPTYLFTQDEYDTIAAALGVVVSDYEQHGTNYSNHELVEKCRNLLSKWE